MCFCEQPRTVKVQTRRARKAHRCCECDRDILPGDDYSYTCGIWDDGPECFKQCLTCADLFRSLIREADHDCGPCYGGLREYALEWIRART